MFGTPTPIPGADTPFVLYRDLLRVRCVQKNGASYLELSLEQTAGEKRSAPQYRSTVLEAIGFGTHLIDYGVALEDLMTAVELQAKAAN